MRVHYRSYSDGGEGDGHAVSFTPVPNDSGYFWFFSPSNMELIVKVLDARAISSSFWVLYGALSDVEYTITVTVTATGTVKSYRNPPHVLASVADTVGLPAAPASGVAEWTAEAFQEAYLSGAIRELAVEVLDARSVNDRFWVLYGALSDVDYTIAITHDVTGALKTYHNPAHHLASAADTNAFAP